MKIFTDAAAIALILGFGTTSLIAADEGGAETPSSNVSTPQMGALGPDAPEAAVAALKEAIKLQFEGKYVNADLEYQNLMALVPEARGVYYQRAVCAFNLQDLDEARGLVMKSLEREEMVADCHNLLGVIAGMEKDHSSAENFFRRAIEVQPKDPQFHFNVGEALRNQARPSEAVPFYREATLLKPQEPLYQFKLMLARLETGDTAGVGERIDEALALESPTGDWLLLAAARHLLAGETDLAVKKMEDARAAMTATMFYASLMDPVFSKHAKEPGFRTFYDAVITKKVEGESPIEIHVGNPQSTDAIGGGPIEISLGAESEPNILGVPTKPSDPSSGFHLDQPVKSEGR